MPNKFQVGFVLKAFDGVSDKLDRVGHSFKRLGDRVQVSNQRFKEFQRSGIGVSKSLDRMSRRVRRAGQSLTTFVTLPLVGAGVAAVKTASDLEESRNKFAQVFDGISATARNNSLKKLTNDFKLADSTALEFLGTGGQILQGLDLSQKESLNFSKRLVGLSQDVASFRNVAGGADQVFRAFTGALTGERERLKTLGIVINETDVRAEALRISQKKGRFETIKQAKAYATLSLIQKLTAKDQGDFKRTQDGLANSSRIFKENLKRLGETFGTILLPFVNKALVQLNQLAERFNKLSPRTKKLVVLFAAMAAGVGPLLLVFAGLLKMGALVIGMFGGLKIAGFAAMLPFIKFIAIGAALAGLAYLIINNWGAIKEFFMRLWEGPLVRFIRFATGFDRLLILPRMLIAAWGPIRSFFGSFFNFVGKRLATFWSVTARIASVIGGGIFGAAKFLAFGPDSNFSGASRVAESQRGQTNTNNASVRVDMFAPKGYSANASTQGDAPLEFNLGFSGALQ